MAPQYQAPAVPPVGVVQPVVAAQAGDRHVMSSVALLRLDKFTKLFPVHFNGTPTEEPQDYLDRCHEVLRNMGIVESNGVDFVVFHMTGSAKRRSHISWGWGAQTPTAQAHGQAAAVYQTQREELRFQFEQLQQGRMSVTDYKVRFSDLSRHALMILPIEPERVQRFVADLHTGIQATMAREVEIGASYKLVVEIAHRIKGVCQWSRE
ncbi:uncharacterized protein [Nicotiana tomentosiformis]|uniref:uncharacterized protein n=1 Tax=Nicotiana tomentosiformis TaxID=4098 RepID=UPI00388C9875